MPKGKIELPNGTTISIKGSAEEIKKIIDFYSSQSQGTTKAKKKRSAKKQTSAKKRPTQSAKGPKQRISELKSQGFFDKQRTIVDIQKKLEEQGHIYAQTSLSPALVRLVRSRDLRRLKKDKVWMYVNP